MMRRLLLPCISIAALLSACDVPEISLVEPVISPSPVTHSLSEVQGRDPAAVTVAIANGGTGTLSGLGIGTIVYAGGQHTGWLSAELAGSTAPASLVLRPRTRTLPAGTYSATVPITAANAQTVNISVNLTVRPGPRIGISRQTVTLASVWTSGASPPDETVRIGNAGEGVLEGLSVGPAIYSAGHPTGWLQWTPLTRTSVSGADSATLAVRAVTAELPRGTYTAKLPVASANGVAGSGDTLTVSVQVTHPPRLALGAAQVRLTMAGPDGELPQAQEVSIRNVGENILSGLRLGEIEYLDHSSQGWLTATLSQTSIAEAEEAVLELAATTTALPAGIHTARVQVSSVTPGVLDPVQPVDVVLVVGPQLVVDTPEVEITRERPQGEVLVSNAGGGTIAGLSVRKLEESLPPTGEGGGWLVVWTAAGSSENEVRVFMLPNLDLFPEQDGLEYGATIEVSLDRAVNSPQLIRLRFLNQ
jgi:hypothetical protein